ncbi:aldo-keto reductase family 1 member A1-A isoform X2 [Nerophis ophidion]|uniref:aldo-keto reductase family 1 member A1-A isoform X2 n=1 Tax=Nerophis ophidion TaxID=159077 RepID=UPI002ADF224E|nr:aldo-keto reductase family 1 member A1-A isoform X2 [Nerophis ophidion]
MGKPSKTPTSKRSRPEDSPGHVSPPGTSFTEILDSIDKRLTCLDSRLALVEVLHREFQTIRESLEFGQQQVVSLAKENAALRESVKSLTNGVVNLTRENRCMKETMLDLQAKSTRDNLVFAGIPEKTEEDPEGTIKSFMEHQLKLPTDTINNITFHRVHRLGAKKPENKRPRPIVAKFDHYKQKEQVECHPYLSQVDLLAHCRSVAVCLTAYSPLGSGDRPWASADEPCLLQDHRLGEISKRCHKTPAQIILRWHLQRGVVCIPKSVTPSRIQQNLQVFDFTLSEQDMKLIDSFSCSNRFIVPTVEMDGKRVWRDAAHPHFPFHDLY